jgi:hypothetical protein
VNKAVANCCFILPRIIVTGKGKYLSRLYFTNKSLLGVSLLKVINNIVDKL